MHIDVNGHKTELSVSREEALVLMSQLALGLAANDKAGGSKITTAVHKASTIVKDGKGMPGIFAIHILE